MRPSLEELDTLVHVVTCGSVTAAAERLRTTKSVVSKRLGTLEKALRATLFHRAGRKMRPTDVGLQIYERAIAVLAQMDDLVEEVESQSGSLKGVIRVAGPMSFGNSYLSPLICDFMRMHPEIDIWLDLDDRYVDLHCGNYDIAIRIGRLEDSALKARKLAVSPRGVYSSPEYARTIGSLTSPDQLANYACLSYANAASGHIWRFESTVGDRPQSLSLPARVLSNSGEILRDSAIAGLGLVALPAFLANDAVKAGTLVEIALPGWCMTADAIHAVYPKTVALPSKVRAFVDYMALRLRPPLPWM